MALHIRAGAGYPLFYYGQSYMGTLEPFSVAALMALVGERPIALRLVPLGYFLLTLGVCGLIIRRHFQAGSVRLFLFFLIAPTAFSVIWTLKARGGYVTGLFLAVVYLLLLLEYRRRSGPLLGVALGFVFGFSLYLNPAMVPALAAPTVVAWLDAGRPGRFRVAAWGPIVVGLLMGVAPVLVHRLLVDGPHRIPGGLSGKFSLERLHLLFLELLPLAGGHLVGTARLPSWETLVPPGPASTRMAEVVLLGANTLAFAAVTYAARRDYWDLLRLRRRRYPPEFYVLTILPAVMVILAVTLLRDLLIVRYLMAATVLLAFYLAAFYRMLEARAATLAYGFAAVVLLSGLGANQHFLRDQDDRRYTATARVLTDRGEDARPLVQFLQARGLSRGYADYWLQWKLVFLSRESLIYTAYDSERYPPYREAVAGEPRPTFIYRVEALTDPQARLAELRAAYGVDYVVERVGRCLVFFAG